MPVRVRGYHLRMRRAVLDLLRRAGLVVHRWPATRVDGMEDALRLLHARGFVPRVVVDCGANQGQWLSVADRVFPGTSYHAIEPQPKCAAVLRAKAASRPDLVVHEVAVSDGSAAEVRMIGGGDGTGTGNYVARPGEAGADAAAYAASTLDRLLGGRLDRADRVLLKLDVEGHELEALAGAGTLLERVEVVVVETAVYDLENSGRPTLVDVVAFMQAQRFEFHDVATLNGRASDCRLQQMDVVFVRADSPLAVDRSW